MFAIESITKITVVIILFAYLNIFILFYYQALLISLSDYYILNIYNLIGVLNYDYSSNL